MIHVRSLSTGFVLLFTVATVACGSSSEVPPAPAAADQLTDKPQGSETPKTASPSATTPSTTTTTTTSANEPKPEQAPDADKDDKPEVDPNPEATFDECIRACETNDCVDACVEVLKKAVGAGGGDGDGGGGDGDDDDGAGMGGDATCCVGSVLWVCHAINSNGASCNANKTPPGKNCERIADNGGFCP